MAKKIAVYPYCNCGACFEVMLISVTKCPKCGYVAPPIDDPKGFTRFLVLGFLLLALGFILIYHLHA